MNIFGLDCTIRLLDYDKQYGIAARKNFESFDAANEFILAHPRFSDAFPDIEEFEISFAIIADLGTEKEWGYTCTCLLSEWGPAEEENIEDAVSQFIQAYDLAKMEFDGQKCAFRVYAEDAEHGILFERVFEDFRAASVYMVNHDDPSGSDWAPSFVYGGIVEVFDGEPVRTPLSVDRLSGGYWGALSFEEEMRVVDGYRAVRSELLRRCRALAGLGDFDLPSDNQEKQAVQNLLAEVLMNLEIRGYKVRFASLGSPASFPLMFAERYEFPVPLPEGVTYPTAMNAVRYALDDGVDVHFTDQEFFLNGKDMSASRWGADVAMLNRLLAWSKALPARR